MRLEDYKAKKLYIPTVVEGMNHKLGARVNPVPVNKLVPEISEVVWKYVLQYGMTPEEAGVKGVYRDRIIVECGDVQMGRRLPFLDKVGTGPKWVTYTDGVAMVGSGDILVTVEDILSMYKVHLAMPDISVMCLLGTSFKPCYRAHLEGIKEIHWMLDGDGAGARGIVKGMRGGLLHGLVTKRLLYYPQDATLKTYTYLRYARFFMIDNMLLVSMRLRDTYYRLKDKIP